MSPSAPYSRTPSAYVSPSMWQTKFYTHTEQQQYYNSLYFNLIFFWPCTDSWRHSVNLTVYVFNNDVMTQSLFARSATVPLQHGVPDVSNYRSSFSTVYIATRADHRTPSQPSSTVVSVGPTISHLAVCYKDILLTATLWFVPQSVHHTLTQFNRHMQLAWRMFEKCRDATCLLTQAPNRWHSPSTPLVQFTVGPYWSPRWLSYRVLSLPCPVQKSQDQSHLRFHP